MIITKRIPWTLVVAAVLIVATGLEVCNVKYRASTRPHHASSEPKAAPVMTVTTKPVAMSSVRTTLPVTGTVYARDQLSIGAEAMGLRIDQVLVEEHDYVTKGQTLAVLDDAVLQAQLQQDEARLQGAAATESKARQPNRPQDIDGLRSALGQAQAMVEQGRANLIQARATLANDQQNADRYQLLLKQGFVTVADANNVFTQAARDKALVAAAEDQVQAAQATASQAQSRLQLAQVGGSWQDVQIASASRAEILGEIHMLQAQIAQTRITAPDDGLIIERDAHIGDISAGGKSLFTMVRNNQLELRAQVPESELSRLQVGDRVQVSGYGKTVAGRIWLITPQVDTNTRLGIARVLLPIRSGYLPGMFVRGVVDEGAHVSVTVPLSAVLGAAGQHHVFLYDNGVARERKVVVGETRGTIVEIQSGLQPGDNLIVDGAAFLNEGDVVTVSTRSLRAQVNRPVSSRDAARSKDS